MPEESTFELLDFKISNFNRVAASLGGFLSVFGLVSYLLKEEFYLSEPLISLIAGLIFSPHATNLVRPLEYARGSEANLDSITLYFTRLVLGVQLVLAGIQLPSRYLRIEWKSLSLLLGPVMVAMWLITSLLVWAMVPHISFLESLAIGSCVTPTDPVLSNSIVKGRFADANIPKELQKIIIAESGANDGLGYPFLFLALYLIKYTGDSGLGTTGGASEAMGYWFGITWGYEIILGVLYGIVVGWIFKDALHWAVNRKYVDRESFLVFALTIALFIVGTAGMIGSDDVLACFIAGNVFTWDDWFRLETKDDSLQPTIDMLLNVSIFAWYGAIAPWYLFAHSSVIPIYRLIFLGILVLLFRRLPVVLLLHTRIHQIEQWRQALFVGFFGPIGVSAIFYLYITTQFLETITLPDGSQRPDAARLQEVIFPVVWFMAICSIIVHGLSVPLGKFGFHFPRAISRALSSERTSRARLDADVPFRVRAGNVAEHAIDSYVLPHVRNARDDTDKSSEKNTNEAAEATRPTKEEQAPRPMRPIGGTVIRDEDGKTAETSSSESEKTNGTGKRLQWLSMPRRGSASADTDSARRTPVERRAMTFPNEEEWAGRFGKAVDEEQAKDVRGAAH